MQSCMFMRLYKQTNTTYQLSFLETLFDKSDIANDLLINIRVIALPLKHNLGFLFHGLVKLIRIYSPVLTKQTSEH